MSALAFMAILSPFRHGESFGGQLVQIGAGVALWSMFIYVGLGVFLVIYESGKGEKERAELDRENDELPSRIGWYRKVFCLRLAVPIALIIEGNRYGQGLPSLILFALSVVAWYCLSPSRNWMRHTR